MLKDIFMRRCMELAAKGLGKGATNPLVGCVIVHEDRIIGEGWHREFGKAHAEVNAINSVTEKQLLPESTLYVNLEPCSHWGKTPPCADLIIENKIKRVVVANIDPFAEVDGRGIEKLRQSGIEVETGLLADDGRILNRRFFCFHEKKRPYVILKWAETADGFIGLNKEEAIVNPLKRQISGPISQRLLHKWRSEERAVMVGTNTAAIDDPRLNVRYAGGNDPVRVVVDRNLKLSKSLHLFDQSQETLVITEKPKDASGRIRFLATGGSAFKPGTFLQLLYDQQILSVLVEGGALMLQSFIDSGLWDESRIFHSPVLFGKGVKAPTLRSAAAEQGPGRLVVQLEHVGDDLLTILQNH